MTGGAGPGLAARVLGIAAAVAVMVAVILVAAPGVVPTGAGAMAPPVPLLVAGRPIPAEADVFRTRPGDLATDPGSDRRAEAHPRTAAMYRSLRAFPGAPPRIPHGLTAEEFRTGRCVACHQRGGFVERFAAYAPVSPHPELPDCLQCHVPDGDLVGIPFTAPTSDAPVCFQCHVLDDDRAPFVALDWPEPAWPDRHQAALPGAPPAIPHDLEFRGNCLACHIGPGAIDDVRTDHADRADCRQCHVPAADAAPFTRSPTAVAEGGSP